MSFLASLIASKCDYLFKSQVYDYLTKAKFPTIDKMLVYNCLEKIEDNDCLYLPPFSLRGTRPVEEMKFVPANAMHGFEGAGEYFQAGVQLVFDLDDDLVRYGVQQYPYSGIAHPLPFTHEFKEKHWQEVSPKQDPIELAVAKYRERVHQMAIVPPNFTSTLVMGSTAADSNIEEEIATRSGEFRNVFNVLVGRLQGAQTRVKSLVFTSTKRYQVVSVSKGGGKTEQVSDENLFIRYAVVQVRDGVFAINHYDRGVSDPTAPNGAMHPLTDVAGALPGTFYTLG